MMKNIFTLLFSIIIYHNSIAQCNGHLDLCQRKYNEVGIVMTHNSYNVGEEDFLFPNQTFSVAKQLEDGVRGLMLDIHKPDNEILVYHSFTTLGTQLLSEDLQEIKAFLDTHPNEIISIIFETNVSSIDLENELISTGLFPYLHHHTLGTEWATLQEMIDNNERLVVFSESNNGSVDQTWYHYAWEHVFDTNYSYSNPSEFDCTLNRGAASNSLYLVNHWITTGFGTGDPAQAAIVNANPLLMNRLDQCAIENNKTPNFIGVDFYELGNAFDAANTLNGITPTSSHEIQLQGIETFPNPCSDQFFIHIQESVTLHCTMYNILGQEMISTALHQGENIISTTELNNGIYFYALSDENGQVISTEKLLVEH